MCNHIVLRFDFVDTLITDKREKKIYINTTVNAGWPPAGRGFAASRAAPRHVGDTAAAGVTSPRRALPSAREKHFVPAINGVARLRPSGPVSRLRPTVLTHTRACTAVAIFPRAYNARTCVRHIFFLP